MPKPTLIDVRSPAEYDAGHLEGAVNCDVRSLAQGDLPTIPKDAPIEVYCASGARSALAKTILEQQGYAQVVDLGGVA